MNARRLWSIVRKETTQILRDRRTLATLLFIPIIQLVLYGYLSSDVKYQSTVVWDQSASPESRALLQAFENTEYFTVRFGARSMAEVERRIDDGDAKVGIVIPPDYAPKVRSGQAVQVMVVVDASDATAARTSLSVAAGVGAAIDRNFQAAELARAGISGRAATPEIRTRAWYNPDLRSQVFIVPGVLALILQFSMTFLAVTVIVKERELGTLEQLVVTPVKPSELMLGKILPLLGLGYLIVTLILLVAWLWFGVPVRGSDLLLYFLILAFFFSVVGLGTLVSTVAANYQQAIQMMQFFLMPSMLLSGFIFPRDTLPKFLQWVSDAMPLTYFLIVVRGVIIKGVGIEYLWPQILALLALGLVVFAAAVMRFQKKIG